MNIIELNKYIKDLKQNNKISTKEISDTHHTFKELYFHRMILFSIICNDNKDMSWKSKLHDDGTMFDGDFIVGITTDYGNVTYHYKMDYWDMFDVKELNNAPKFDGHTPDVAIARLNAQFNKFSYIEKRRTKNE